MLQTPFGLKCIGSSDCNTNKCSIHTQVSSTMPTAFALLNCHPPDSSPQPSASSSSIQHTTSTTSQRHQPLPHQPSPFPQSQTLPTTSGHSSLPLPLSLCSPSQAMCTTSCLSSAKTCSLPNSMAGNEGQMIMCADLIFWVFGERARLG
ncbi:hypothetical protein K504DRAFT_249097 [Pleomassaria siparia CBS 279.74]|uniref:Uncharacterized protein n=1 Tax=Pleomassaria siparia CBS 279.74 TaxID=1314801 RepID=A0A6G1KC13_9PLEO|nr:hypothetical protein K504DRAFT_249097 [Pleomassaria siparia CBS 279.74]